MATNAFAAGAYQAIQNLAASGGARPRPSAAASADFGGLLQEAVGGVAEAGAKADRQAAAVAAGRADVVDVVTAVAESEVALQTLVAVRDRVIAAYEEIMRMPV
jgi:flagellar hook-basal body complex protein FliE